MDTSFTEFPKVPRQAHGTDRIGNVGD